MDFSKYSEGKRAIEETRKKGGELPAGEKKNPVGKIDRKRLVIYSEIMKPKFDG